MKPAIQKQVNQVKIWLSDGLTTEQIRKEFAKKYENLRLADRTIDNRIKQAKESTPPLIQKETDKVDSKILQNEKEALNELTKARTRAQDFLTATINEIVEYGEKLKKENPKDLSYLKVFKTANKSGFSFEKILPLIRLEEGLPSSINNNNNKNEDITPPKAKVKIT